MAHLLSLERRRTQRHRNHRLPLREKPYEHHSADGPIHPGEILAEDYLAPLGITQHRLAVAIHVPPRRVNEIVHGKRRISANTALRLARYFGTSERFWMNRQGRYDLELERDRLASVLDEIHPRTSA